MKIRFYILLLLLNVKLYPQVSFSEEIVVQDNHMRFTTKIVSQDLNNDFYQDVIVLSSTKENLIYFKNIAGQGNFDNGTTLNSKNIECKDFFIADLNSDGFRDIVAVTWDDTSTSLVWYNNQHAAGRFVSTPIAIFPFYSSSHLCYCFDYDKDGDQDVILYLRSRSEIYFYENLDSLGNFGYSSSIYPPNVPVNKMLTWDLDNDGAHELITLTAEYINLYKKKPQNSYTLYNSIDKPTDSDYHDIFVSDIDSDDDPDFIISLGYGSDILFMYNLDNTGFFGDYRYLQTEDNYSYRVVCVDVDKDGDNDIVSQSNSNFCVYENINGLGEFDGPQTTGHVPCPRDMCLSDLDQNGYEDIIFGTCYIGGMSWLPNIEGEFQDPLSILAFTGGLVSVVPTDIDHDGDIDLLSASRNDNKIALYENLDGKGSMGKQVVICDSAESITSLKSSDLNSDGLNDLLYSTLGDNQVVWLMNSGNNKFSEQNLISEMYDNPRTVHATDIDNDSDIDVIVGYDLDNMIILFKNIDSHGNYSEGDIIYSANYSRNNYWTINTADFDNDQDNDLVTSSSNYRLQKFENLDGFGAFGTPQSLGMADYSIDVGDIDGDNDIDILGANGLNNYIGWSENILSSGEFDFHLISSSMNGVRSVFLADIDDDGDLDVLSASEYDNKISVFINKLEIGEFAELVISDELDFAFFVTSADIDSDGDEDIIACGMGKIVYYKNLSELTSINNASSLSPNEFILSNNYPNPFNSFTNISFTLSAPSNIKIIVYDILGQLVETVINKHYDAGKFIVKYDASKLESGVYFYRVESEMSFETRKMIVLK